MEDARHGAQALALCFAEPNEALWVQSLAQARRDSWLLGFEAACLQSFVMER